MRMQRFRRLRLLLGTLVVLLVLGFALSSARTLQIRVARSLPPTPSPAATVVPAISPNPTPIGSPSLPAQRRTFPTVFLILMENHNWSGIFASSAAPYINHILLPMSSYARAYYNPPRIHPSEPNYLWLEAGTNFGILDDGAPASNRQSTSAHLVTLLKQANISWKSYQEDISGTACPLTTRGLYAVKHNPMVFFNDVTDNNNPQSAYCIAHVRPYTDLAMDIQNNTVASYNFITPNICNDMHDSCAPSYNAVRQGDSWLEQQIPLIRSSQAYKDGGVIFITWDEGEGSDGPIGMIVLSSFAKGNGYSNNIHYTHSSTLRTIEELFGVTPLLGDAANAPDLADLFLSFPF